MDRRLSDVQVTFKRRRSGEDLYASATQLVSIAPTQHDGSGAEAAAVGGTLPRYPPPYPPLRQRQEQQQQQQGWGIPHEAASFWQEVDQEELLETEVMSLQTTPGASRAASPGPGLPCTAPQPAGADLAAIITQQLGEGTPGSEEIRRHYPRVQEQYRQYQRLCVDEQQLSPLGLQDFYKHSHPRDRGAPAL